ncbi:hypothetical protein ABN224_16950 [Providencia rettgeri]
MKLIKKNILGNNLYRSLSEYESKAIESFCGKTSKYSVLEKELAIEVLQTMYEFSLWLVCDCNKNSDALTISTVKLYSNKLFLVKIKGEHVKTCLLYKRKDNEDSLSRGYLKQKNIEISVKDLSSMENKINPNKNNFLPNLDSLLYELIISSGINEVNFPTLKGRMDAINHLKRTVENKKNNLEKTLYDVIFFESWISKKLIIDRILELEKDDNSWPAGKDKFFFQVLTSRYVSRDKVIFGNQCQYHPELPVRLNCENEVNNPLYWVILLFQRNNKDNVVCREAYAHLFYSDSCSVPINSDLERKLINSIVFFINKINKRDYCFSIYKSLRNGYIIFSARGTNTLNEIKFIINAIDDRYEITEIKNYNGNLELAIPFNSNRKVILKCDFFISYLYEKIIKN